MADLLLVKMGYVQDTCEKQGFEVDPISVVEHFTLGRHFGIQQKNVDISGLVGRSVSEPVQCSHRTIEIPEALPCWRFKSQEMNGVHSKMEQNRVMDTSGQVVRHAVAESSEGCQ